MVIPFYRAMRIYLPRFKRLCAAARKDGIELIHLTTPGPVGLAALYVAAVLADLDPPPGLAPRRALELRPCRHRRAGPAMAASAAFTVVPATFTLFAMRRGASSVTTTGSRSGATWRRWRGSS